jgi:uncharacterized membrane protein YphA (DoxX/SURF4 family)
MRRLIFWVCTAITVLCMGIGGVVYLLGLEGAVTAVKELGYPGYFVTLLGTAKVLGALTVALPGFARLKEWAYAGIAIDLCAAVVSNAASGHGAYHTLAPAVIFGIAMTSWALRPESRRLGHLGRA